MHSGANQSLHGANRQKFLARKKKDFGTQIFTFEPNGLDGDGITHHPNTADPFPHRHQYVGLAKMANACAVC